MRLLLHERSYGRVKLALESLNGVEVLLVDDDGQITLGGAPVNPEAARPEAGWANVDTFFSGAAPPFMSALLGSPDLKWVQSSAAGFDNPVFAQIVAKGARLTTSHGQAAGMADYVLWGVLDVFQGGIRRRAFQAAGAWERTTSREIWGSNWTILGFGAIGRGVALRARAFGAHITAIRRSVEPDPAADRMATRGQFLDLLPDTDVLVLAAPLSPETRRIADAAAFARMKPGSILANVGRGPLVDETALLAALDRDAPGHAVLDVFETEPLPADSRFWSHPKVTLTPHSSGISLGNPARNDATFVENLRRYLAGEPLVHEARAADVLAN